MIGIYMLGGQVLKPRFMNPGVQQESTLQGGKKEPAVAES